MTQSLHILFLADNRHHTGAVADHINAIVRSSPHHWYIENPLVSKTLHKLDLSQFDAIGFHYSIRPHDPYYLPPPLYAAIKKYQGLKFQFLQDEYQQVCVAEAAMVVLNIQVLFTLVQQALVDKAYRHPQLSQMKKVTVLTAYVPEQLLNYPARPLAGRKLDIFYRSRTCEFWLGSLAQDKLKIAEGVLQRASQYHLKVDVSVREEDRIYGKDWLDRLSGARAVLGTESGVSIWDYDGTIEKKTKQYLREHPEATFDAVEQAVLKPYEGNVMYNAISPRVFEAVALKTPLIMFPGEYSGVCKAGEHYIVLEKDFSNFAKVVEKLKDDIYLQTMVDKAHQDLIASKKYSEEQLASLVSRTLEETIVVPSAHREKQTLEALISKNKAENTCLNLYYIILSESRFILKNLRKILFDQRYSLKQKIIMLYKGVHRYFVYIIPRYFSQRPKCT